MNDRDMNDKGVSRGGIAQVPPSQSEYQEFTSKLNDALTDIDDIVSALGSQLIPARNTIEWDEKAVNRMDANSPITLMISVQINKVIEIKETLLHIKNSLTI
jgi:hypothetical protein